MKRERTGFTLVELLTVLAIITMLVGLLVPSMATVRRFARETKQRAQLTTIDLALTAFRDEYGEYPPSEYEGALFPDYCAAHKLAEALLGWDLMGFHPRSDFRASGSNDAGEFVYDPASLGERRGPYLELGTRNAFRLGVSGPGMDDGLFKNTDSLAADRYVICDVFGVRRVTLAANGRTVTAGTPILYYRANTSSRSMIEILWSKRIYDAADNQLLTSLGVLAPDGSTSRPHRLYNGVPGEPAAYFYSLEYKILDPKVTAVPWPHRPDSYILISAGADGEYGTADDITNFGD